MLITLIIIILTLIWAIEPYILKIFIYTLITLIPIVTYTALLFILALIIMELARRHI